MSKAMIYTANTASQSVTVPSVLNLGTVIRRFGCDCQLSGNGITLTGTGYYKISANVTAAPTAAGTVTAALYKDGVAVPGAIASETTGAAAASAVLPIDTVVRVTCPCNSTATLTLVLSGADSTVTNVAMVVEKL